MLLHKSIIICLAFSAMTFNFISSMISDIEFCDIFQKCLMTNNTDTNNTYNVETSIPSIICFDMYFCDCTKKNDVCSLIDQYFLDLMIFMSQIIFYSILAIFMCILCSNQRQYFIEETNIKYFWRKLIILSTIYVCYIIFNIFIGTIVNLMLYDKIKVSFGDSIYIHIPWIITVLLLPIYIVFGTLHNEQIKRAIYLQRNSIDLVINNNPLMEDCPICTDSLQNNEIVVTLSCSPEHNFHKDCLMQWYIIKNECPLCREPIVPEGRQIRGQDNYITI